MRICNPTKPGNRLGMPLEAWPVQDQTAWHAAFAPGSLLDEHPHGRDLRPASRVTIATCYARWLAWLKANHPDAWALPPGERASRAHITAYIEALCLEVSVGTVFNYACRLKSALQLIAPETELSWLTPALRRLERKARAAREAKPKPFVPSAQLYAFGIELMQQADASNSWDDVLRAEAYRDGLMIAFLASRPLRIKNLLGLAIGSSFVAANDGYEVALPRQETKTKVDLDFAIPAKLTDYMGRYLAHHRKILAAGPHGAMAGYLDQANYLWLARSGGQFPVATCEAMIATRTSARFGVRLTPHKFRDCAATSIAENNPEDFHIIRIILGHACITTAERHYIRVKKMQAVSAVQDNLISMRQPPAQRRLPKNRP